MLGIRVEYRILPIYPRVWISYMPRMEVILLLITHSRLHTQDEHYGINELLVLQ